MSYPSTPSTSKEADVESDHQLCIDTKDQVLKLLDGDFDVESADRHVLVQKIPSYVVNEWFGEVIEQRDIDESKDEVTHCDACNKFYHRFCRQHPLYFCPDNKVSTDAIPDGLTKADVSLPPFLEIKESSIENAGKGVFSLMDIPVGTCFGPYKGEKKTEPNKKGYIWEIRKEGKPSFYRDGQDPSKSNWMRYINSARHEDEQNLIAFQYEWKVFYRVFKPISAGVELLGLFDFIFFMAEKPKPPPSPSSPLT
uniref:SET domain-containing protein n=1 Tax=Steinernema glaseri TaxID=37863 RepID=A0A1I7ZXR5_9BILA